MKQPYDPVTLRMTHWSGIPAKAGDGLITRTGRKYLILEIIGKKHKCMVLAPDDVISGAFFNIQWNKRNRNG